MMIGLPVEISLTGLLAHLVDQLADSSSRYRTACRRACLE
jgi:hypothetical protein